MEEKPTKIFVDNVLLLTHCVYLSTGLLFVSERNYKEARNGDILHELDGGRRVRRHNHLDPIYSNNMDYDRRMYSSSAGVRRDRHHHSRFIGERRRSLDESRFGFFGRNRRLSSVGDISELENGDNVVLVREGRPSSSPVMVRILRAITPRWGRSAGGRRSKNNPSYERQDSRSSRIFQIVKESLDRVSACEWLIV